jgi:hypothetical protein
MKKIGERLPHWLAFAVVGKYMYSYRDYYPEDIRKTLKEDEKMVMNRRERMYRFQPTDSYPGTRLDFRGAEMCQLFKPGGGVLQQVGQLRRYFT